mmetsp:Transcript_25222/g.81595  ORF Transcript_25222/g.81595 Transcript_25222/m.81595 type:complete len:108 (+) Transcript_25222:803-1126(+)
MPAGCRLPQRSKPGTPAARGPGRFASPTVDATHAPLPARLATSDFLLHYMCAQGLKQQPSVQLCGAPSPVVPFPPRLITTAASTSPAPATPCGPSVSPSNTYENPAA